MKKLKLSIVFVFLFVVQILPQDRLKVPPDWPIAPEVWSEPVLLDSVFIYPFSNIESSALTPNFDTIYFSAGPVYSSVKTNGKWEKPKKLNSNINVGAGVRDCSISKDGRRLYFSGYGGYGAWDIWYSDIDSNTNDWGPGYNMGPQINSASNDAYFYEVSKDTAYVLQCWTMINYYIYNNRINQWSKIDSFWYHPLGGVEMYGVSITKDKKKMYFGRFRYDNWIYDLGVCYWDSSSNQWGSMYNLNINTEALKVGNVYRRGAEFYPWISGDGKKMVFSSNRDASLEPNSSSASSLYITYLLIDENGDTVTTVEDKASSQPKDFTLRQNYPNPFNPATTIKYSIKNDGYVKLIIYDSIGRKITELVNEYKNKGEYTIHFDSQKLKLASGTYYYQLIHNNDYLVKKMMLTK